MEIRRPTRQKVGNSRHHYHDPTGIIRQEVDLDGLILLFESISDSMVAANKTKLEELRESIHLRLKGLNEPDSSEQPAEAEESSDQGQHWADHEEVTTTDAEANRSNDEGLLNSVRLEQSLRSVRPNRGNEIPIIGSVLGRLDKPIRSEVKREMNYFKNLLIAAKLHLREILEETLPIQVQLEPGQITYFRATWDYPFELLGPACPEEPPVDASKFSNLDIVLMYDQEAAHKCVTTVKRLYGRFPYMAEWTDEKDFLYHPIAQAIADRTSR